MGANVCPKYGGRVQGPTGIPTPIRVMESETHTDASSIHGARSPPFILHGTRLAYSTRSTLVSFPAIFAPTYSYTHSATSFALIWINFKSCTSISRRNLPFFHSSLAVSHSLLLARRSRFAETKWVKSCISNEFYLYDLDWFFNKLPEILHRSLYLPDSFKKNLIIYIA